MRQSWPPRRQHDGDPGAVTKPSTIAALAVLVCTPALVSFASGGMPAMSLGLWYLGALVLVGAGAHLLQRVVSHYSEQAKQDARDVADSE